MSRGGRRAAVLGGSGFVGYAVTEGLLRAGFSVVTVNRGRTPASFSRPVERIRADREDPESYARALAGIGAEAVVDVTAYRPEETRVAVEAFRGRIRRFVHISTLSVYRWPFPCPVAEDWPLETDPGKTYGFGKAGCERVLLAEPVSALPWTILRLPAIFGPRDPHYREMGLLRSLMAGDPVFVPERPFLCQNIFVRDAASAVRRLIETPAATGRAYNAGGPPFRLEDYAGLAARLSGKPLRLKRISRRALEREGIDPDETPYFFEGDLVLDTRRIREEAGFEPGSDLEQALQMTLDDLTRRAAGVTDAPPPG